MENKKLEQALNDITYLTPKFPEEAFRVICENQEEAVPWLMEALERAILEQDELPEGYQLHFYSMFLLSQFGCQEAFPTLIKLASCEPDVLDNLIGDAVTESLPNIFYSTYDGNRELLVDFLKNDEADGYARAGGLDVLVQRYLDKEDDKEELTGLLRELIYQSYDRGALDTSIMGVIIKCHFIEMLPDVRYLFREDRIDEMAYGEYDSCVDILFDYSYDRGPVCRKIMDAAAVLRGWAMFEQPESTIQTSKQQEKAMERMLQEWKRERNLTEKKVKIGRNDPCPCGSGKKYKNCCLNKPAVEVIESKREQDKCLKEYPQAVDPEQRIPGRIYLEDYFDQESIQLDKFLYLGMKRGTRCYANSVAYKQILERDRKYLWKAFGMYADRCDKEGIGSPQEYDEKYMVHYSAASWLDRLMKLLEQEGMYEEYRQVRKYAAGE